MKLTMKGKTWDRFHIIFLFGVVAAQCDPAIATDYYEEDKTRVPVFTLPADQQNIFAATGTIRCPGGMSGTAQLTVRPDIITTAGHLLYDPISCQRSAKADVCTFSIVSYGRSTDIAVTQEIDSGLKDCSRARARDDWLILKLKRTVDDVEPYKIEKNVGKFLKIGDRVSTIASSLDFLVKDKNGNLVEAKAYGECRIMQAYGVDDFLALTPSALPADAPRLFGRNVDTN
jgi:hypothetical protein